MVRAGRLARVHGRGARPARLARAASPRAWPSQNANIEEVHHQRAFTALAVQNAELDLVLKTRNHEHVEQIVEALQRDRLQRPAAHPV